MLRTAFLLLLLSSVFVHAGDGPEFLVDTSRQLVPSAAFEEYPSAAFDGANYLVVWGGDAGLRGTFIRPNGSLVDSGGLMVLNLTWPNPKVAFGGGVYLAVYNIWTGSQSDVYAVRVSPSGQVLDPDGFPVCTAIRDQDETDVTFNGTNFLVVWDDDREGGDTLTDIYAARVTTAGLVLDPNGFPVTTGGYEKVEPAVASDGTNCLVVWHGCYHDTAYYSIWGARVAPNGSVLDPEPFQISHNRDDVAQSPDVAFNGTNYLVAWDDANSGHMVSCSRVAPSGTVLDTADIRVAQRSRPCEYPTVSADGTNWLVAWDDDTYSSGQNLFGARISAAGASLDPSGFALCNAAFQQGQGTIAFGNGQYLVAWQDQRQGGSEADVYVARVTPAGAVLEPNGFAISFSVNEGDYAAVASDGTDFLMAWRDGRGAGDIFATRISAGGTILDRMPLNVSLAAGNQTNPTVAFDGTNYLVVWQDNRDTGNANLYGARVSRAGMVIDSPAVRLTSTRYDDYWPRMTFDGVNYYIVWRYEWYHHVWAMRVRPDMVVLDTNGFQVSFEASTQMQPDIAPCDTMCLITWQQYPNPEDIWGARVARSGVLLDSPAVRIAAAPHTQGYARVASSGTNWLAVWSDQRSLRHWDIFAGIVNRDGRPVDSLGFAVSIADSGHVKSMPDVGFDGTNYQLVWADDRNRGQWQFDLYGATVSPAGTVLATYAVAIVPQRTWYPELGSSGSQLMLGFTSWTGTVNQRSYNGKRIWAKPGPLPGIAQEPVGLPAERPSGPTIIRGVLRLPANMSAVLLDVTGRRVHDLPGALAGKASGAIRNHDVSRLPPGVYFISVRSAEGGRRSADAVRKVVIQR
jgi:hypothetical protein